MIRIIKDEKNIRKIITMTSIDLSIPISLGQSEISTLSLLYKMYYTLLLLSLENISKNLYAQ